MQYISPPVPSNQAADPVAGFVPCYDIAGNLLFQHSMDAGDRWMLNDAAGKPMFAWDSRDHQFLTDYDALHRPVGSFVKGADPDDLNRIIQFEKVIYGDTPANGLSDAQKTQLNLRGKPYKHYDTAGLVISLGRNSTTGADEAFDFQGNPLRSTRQLIKNYKNTPDWSQNPVLEAEIFSSSTRYDALNRPIQLVAPHSNQANTKFNVIRPGYNEANLLERMDVWLEQTAEPTALLNPTTANLKAVTNIDYDAKGQRIRIDYNEANHPVITKYTYDPQTFRLSQLLSTRPNHPEADKRTLQDLSYTYDPVGNITEIRDKAQQMVFFDNSLIEPSYTYVYDALYRLIRAEGREHAVQSNMQRDAKKFEPIVGIPFPNSPEALQRYSEDYEYDPVGNILGFYHTGGGTERWVRRYQYALDSNRLLATRLPGEAANLPNYAATPGYGAKYTYDPHGNMTAMPHLKVMEWDFKDQLHATQQQVVNNGVGEKTYYFYDAGGQRVRKVTETQNGKPKDERIYLGGFEVYRKYNGNGQAIVLERETLHIMDDKQRVALVETRTRLQGADQAPRQLVRFQLSNHLGSAALELDNQAQVISYEEYHPYGSTAYQAARSQTETPKRYRYTGKEQDEETGFSYHGARYYAPWLGRWVSCDPAGLADGTNVFAYCSQNPVMLCDPSGNNGEDSSRDPGLKDPKSMTLDEYRAVNARRKDGGLSDDKVVRQYNLDHAKRGGGRSAGADHGKPGGLGSKNGNDSGDQKGNPNEKVGGTNHNGKGIQVAGGASGFVGGTGKKGDTGSPKTELDYAVLLAKALDLDPDFIKNSKDGVATGGIPDGIFDWRDPSTIGQAACVAFQAISTLLSAKNLLDTTLKDLVLGEAASFSFGLLFNSFINYYDENYVDKRIASNDGYIPTTNPPSLPPGVSPYQLSLFPLEPYNRAKHYGTPKFKAIPKGSEFEHPLPLSQHYYEGHGPGSLAGYNFSKEERFDFAKNPSLGYPETPKFQRSQGGTFSGYSKSQKRKWFLPKR